MPVPVAMPAREVTPFPVAPATTPLANGFAEALTEGALAVAPEISSPPPSDPEGEAPSAESAREAICAALASAGHISASQLLGSGVWTMEHANLRLEVAGMGKKMLSLTVNAAAEKIIRQELQRLGASSRFVIVPGAATGGGPAPTLTPIAGSVQEEALKHPLVQRAKEILKAEVRSVMDLRGQ
jgi:DNA polymerase III subunit gamma/tau